MKKKDDERKWVAKVIVGNMRDEQDFEMTTCPAWLFFLFLWSLEWSVSESGTN